MTGYDPHLTYLTIDDVENLSDAEITEIMSKTEKEILSKFNDEDRYMKVNQDRILTLQVKITEPDKARWIWRNHVGFETGHGIFIQSIKEGVIPKELEDDDD